MFVGSDAVGGASGVDDTGQQADGGALERQAADVIFWRDFGGTGGGGRGGRAGAGYAMKKLLLGDAGGGPTLRQRTRG